MMRIAIGCDHSALSLKSRVMDILTSLGLEYTDLGTYTEDSCDYPVYAGKVCTAVTSGEYDRGILICGTGIGMSICANKYNGIRAALCSDTRSAALTREHNDANVLVLGARIIDPAVADEIVRIFFSTPFSGEERHIRRIAMIGEAEKNN